MESQFLSPVGVPPHLRSEGIYRVHTSVYIPLICVYNKFIDLFRKGYLGLKLDFRQLIPHWSSGLVVWFMIIGLRFDSPHNRI